MDSFSDGIDSKLAEINSQLATAGNSLAEVKKLAGKVAP